MTDTEWIAKLDADFGKLQRNRQQVPLERLETTYAKSYKALIGRLTEAADWFADRYLQTLTEHWPRHPKDTAGNEWLERKVAAIIEEENQAGGLRDKWRLALVAHSTGKNSSSWSLSDTPGASRKPSTPTGSATTAGRESRGAAGSTTTSSAGFGSRRGKTRTSPMEPGSTATTRFTPAAGHQTSEPTWRKERKHEQQSKHQ